MGTIEVPLPDRLEHEIARLIEDGEFVSEAEAIEQLLNTGLPAYKANSTHNDDPEYGVDDPSFHDDEYAF